MAHKNGAKPHKKKKRVSSFKGHHHTIETKKKMRLAKLGKPKSLATRMKMSLAKKGKPGLFSGHLHSAEAKARMAESARRRWARERRIKNKRRNKK